MNSQWQSDNRLWSGLGLAACLVMSAVSVFAQGEGYVPPPSGPYQSSAVIIERANTENVNEREVYRFPPSNILLPETQVRQFKDFERPPGIEPTVNPLPPSVHRRPESPPPQMSSPEPWAYPNYPTQPQMYSAPQNHWYGYQGGVWQQPAPGYGYYPYAGSNQYPQSFGPFGNMPSPWSVMPKKPFSGTE